METYDDRLFQGSVSEAAADSFVLTCNGRSTTLQYEEVRKIKWPPEASKQAEVAVAVTAVFGSLFVALVLLGGFRG